MPRSSDQTSSATRRRSVRQKPVKKTQAAPDIDEDEVKMPPGYYDDNDDDRDDDHDDDGNNDGNEGTTPLTTARTTTSPRPRRGRLT